MTRLLTAGAEHRDNPTVDIGSPDGYSAGSVLRATDTVNTRSSPAAFLYAGTAAGTSYSVRPFTVPASGVSGFPRVYFWTDALPSATVRIGALRTAADGALISVRLTSAGKLQLWNDVAGTQIGSDSALTVETDRIYRWLLRLKIAAGAADEAELLVKTDDYQDVDEQVAVATGLSLSDTHAARLLDGWIDAPGLTANLRTDDIALNDSAGTDHNTWPSDGRVIATMPVQAGSIGIGSWTGCDGGAAPWDGTSKRPPVGLADHTTAGHTGASAHQARCAVNTQQSMGLTCQTFAAAGAAMPTGHNPASPGAGVTGTVFGQTAANTRRALSSKFGRPTPVDSVMVAVGKVGSPTDNLLFELQSDSAGAPSGTVLASAVPIPGSSLATSYTRMRLAFDQTVVLAAGATYWLVAYRSGALDVSNYYYWSKGSTGTDAVPEVTPAVYNGTSWLQSGVQWNVGEHVMCLTPSSGAEAVVFAAQFVCHGEGATGVKGGAVDAIGFGTGIVPQETFNYGDNVGVAGTFPINWRYAVGVGGRPRMAMTAAAPSVTINKLSGSGTNPCLACAAGIIIEVALTEQSWTRWVKGSDSTVWWAKRCITTTTFETGTDGLTIVVVDAGDWAIYPDPQVPEGGNFPTTLTSIDESALYLGYVQG